jgi:hypothetical protein
MNITSNFFALAGAIVTGVVALTMGALVLSQKGGATSAILAAGGTSTANVIGAIGQVANGTGI